MNDPIGYDPTDPTAQPFQESIICYRAVVFVKRKRSSIQDALTCEEYIEGLGTANNKYASVRETAAVLGRYDIVLVIDSEVDNFVQIHRFINFLCDDGRDYIRSTNTAFFVPPLSKNEHPVRPLPYTPYPVRKRGPSAPTYFYVLIKCLVGAHDAVAKSLADLPCVKMANVLFGEYSIIALVESPHGSDVMEFLYPITQISGVESTETMQVYRDRVPQNHHKK